VGLPRGRFELFSAINRLLKPFCDGNYTPSRQRYDDYRIFEDILPENPRMVNLRGSNGFEMDCFVCFGRSAKHDIVPLTPKERQKKKPLCNTPLSLLLPTIANHFAALSPRTKTYFIYHLSCRTLTKKYIWCREKIALHD